MAGEYFLKLLLVASDESEGCKLAEFKTCWLNYSSIAEGGTMKSGKLAWDHILRMRNFD